MFRLEGTVEVIGMQRFESVLTIILGRFLVFRINEKTDASQRC
jgi:hypothetical protein